MDISAKLADLNWQRNTDWKTLLLKMRVLPFMLLMEMFIHVDAYSIPIEKLEKLQDSLRILSGLWVVETVGFNPGLSIRDGDEVAC
jgi:cytoplasmic iron level regulating protein YaaA (DUF328/UPF0246 family)